MESALRINMWHRGTCWKSQCSCALAFANPPNTHTNTKHTPHSPRPPSPSYFGRNLCTSWDIRMWCTDTRLFATFAGWQVLLSSQWADDVCSVLANVVSTFFKKVTSHFHNMEWSLNNPCEAWSKALLEKILLDFILFLAIIGPHLE